MPAAALQVDRRGPDVAAERRRGVERRVGRHRAAAALVSVGWMKCPSRDGFLFRSSTDWLVAAGRRPAACRWCRRVLPRCRSCPPRPGGARRSGRARRPGRALPVVPARAGGARRSRRAAAVPGRACRCPSCRPVSRSCPLFPPCPRCRRLPLPAVPVPSPPPLLQPIETAIKPMRKRRVMGASVVAYDLRD